MISTWSKAKLAEVAPSTPLKVKNVDAEDKVWQLNLNHIESNTGKLIQLDIQPYSEAGTSTHWFDEHHVLYSKLRPYLNKVLLPQQKGLATTELVPMLPNERLLNRKYLAYYLKSKQFVDWVSAQTAGAKMPRVSMKVFWEHKIPLPPLAEQQKIAAILDAADQLRQKDQQLIDHYTTLSQSLFLEMFGDPVTNPMGWNRRPLSEIVKSVIDCPHTTPKWTNSGKVAIRTSNLTKGGWKWNDKRFVSEEEFNNRSKRAYVKEGDIVLSREGTIGVLAIVKKGMEICLGQRLVQLIPDIAIGNKYYLLHLLLLELEPERINRVMVGATSKHLNVRELRAMKLPVPSLELQNQFAQHIEKIEQQKQYAQASREHSETLFNSLLQRAFKGELTNKDQP